MAALTASEMQIFESFDDFDGMKDIPNYFVKDGILKISVSLLTKPRCCYVLLKICWFIFIIRVIMGKDLCRMGQRCRQDKLKVIKNRIWLVKKFQK